MLVYEAKDVYQDHSQWKVTVSAYHVGKRTYKSLLTYTTAHVYTTVHVYTTEYVNHVHF